MFLNGILNIYKYVIIKIQQEVKAILPKVQLSTIIEKVKEKIGCHMSKFPNLPSRANLSKEILLVFVGLD